jgi:hypothetical protein
MKRSVRHLIAALSLIGIFIASAVPVAFSAYNGIDPMVPMAAPVFACMNDTEMDCIESIVIIHPDGTKENAELVSKERNVWKYHSLKLDGPVVELYPGASIWTRTYIQAGESKPRPVLDVQGDSQNLNPLEKIQFTMRMSWLRPQDVALHAKDAFFKAEPIIGGTRYIFGGSSYVAGLVNDWAAWNAVMDTKEVKTVYGYEMKYGDYPPNLYKHLYFDKQELIKEIESGLGEPKRIFKRNEKEPYDLTFLNHFLFVFRDLL